MFSDSIDAFPTPNDRFADDVRLAPAAPPETEAERKRRERRERREAGLPDPRVVDVAIVAALATILEQADVVARAQRQGGLGGLTVDLEGLMAESLRNLRRGKIEGVRVSRPAAVEALKQRLRMRDGRTPSL